MELSRISGAMILLRNFPRDVIICYLYDLIKELLLSGHVTDIHNFMTLLTDKYLNQNCLLSSTLEKCKNCFPHYHRETDPNLTEHNQDNINLDSNKTRCGKVETKEIEYSKQQKLLKD